MRKEAAIMALALVLATSVLGKERPSWAYRALQTGYVLGQGVDLGMTWVAVTRLGYYEANPVADMFQADFISAVAYNGALTLGLLWLSDKCWRENRALGWFITGASVVFKGWVLWHNLRSIGR